MRNKRSNNHQLSFGTLSAVTAFAVYASSGGKKETQPPINAASPEEEKFIVDFLKEQKEKH